MAGKRSKGNRLIFIGGSPRSGTTLLQNMLDSHPLILGGPEFLHLNDIIELRRKLHYSIDREWINLFCSREDVDDYLVATVEKLFLSLAEKHHFEFYSEKTPENILVFAELTELFPEAHFIQVVRDPRAIVSSMKQAKKRATGKGLKPPHFCADISTSIAYAKKCFNAGFKAEKLSPGKLLTIVYEQLIESPESETKRICKYIGVEWDDRMLHPGDKEHLGQQAITTKSNEIWYNAKTYNQNIVLKNKEKWRSELSLAEQLKITVAFADNRELRKYGYDFTVESLARGNHMLLRFFLYGLFFGKNIYNQVSWLTKKIPAALR